MKKSSMGLWLTAGLTAACAAVEPATFERPGVRADRATRTVRVEAFATDVAAGTRTEFFLIGPRSGHAYEAVAVAKAQPSDIHAALEFIGMKPGRVVDPNRLAFWPRGERVLAFFEWTEGEGAAAVTRRARVESTIIDTRTGKPLPEEGFAFTGSRPAANEQGATAYAADEVEPFAILTAYNSPITVLDVPRQADQNALYEMQERSSEPVFRANQPLTLVLQPERPAGPPRVWDLTLRAAPGAAGALALTLTDPAAKKVLCEASDAKALQAALRPPGPERDPFLTLELDPGLTMKQAQAFHVLVEELVSTARAAIEPSHAEDLYYKAWLPNPAFRTREGRPAQPWELTIRHEGESLGGALTKVTESWNADTDTSTYQAEPYPFHSPAELRAAMDAHGPGLPVLLVFAPGDLPYRDLKAFLAPLRPTHPTVFLFVD